MDKRMPMSDAIDAFVHDGNLVAIEGFGNLVPVAAAQEIIRQLKRGLTLSRMSCDVIVDQLLAAGCVSKLISSFVGNSSAGSLHELRRRLESSDPEPLELEEYSHGGMVARYTAGASRLPFLPVKSYRGSDLVAMNPNIRAVTDPYGSGGIYVVPALRPDVSIVHAQRSDKHGNVQAWGILGVQTEAAFAADRVIVTVEEIVDEQVIRSDPNRTIIAAHVVSAIVESPWGAYPHAVQGYYERDDAFSREWSQLSQDPQRLLAWLSRHIHSTASFAEHLASLGSPHNKLRGSAQAYATPVNYGGRQ
jgi:glutaconate CoA-transferase subunit A